MENTITHPTPNSGKRSRKEMDSDSESDSEIGMDSWPRFLIMESTDSDKPLTKLSPFVLQKGIQGLAGVPKDVNRLRSGQVLIEVDRKSHCRHLLQSNMIVDVPIRISPHKSLNFKKGIIRCRDLRGCSDDEILESEGVKEQGITDVKRFKIKKRGDLVDTNTFLITFGLPTLPQCIKLGYLRIPVEMHIPNPMRCFVCQRFGGGCRIPAVACWASDHWVTSSNPLRGKFHH